MKPRRPEVRRHQGWGGCQEVEGLNYHRVEETLIIFHPSVLCHLRCCLFSLSYPSTSRLKSEKKRKNKQLWADSGLESESRAPVFQKIPHYFTYTAHRNSRRDVSALLRYCRKRSPTQLNACFPKNFPSHLNRIRISESYLSMKPSSRLPLIQLCIIRPCYYL